MRVGVGSLRASLAGAGLLALLGAPLSACGLSNGSSVATIQVTASDAGFDPGTVRLDKPGVYNFHYTNSGTRSYGLDIEGNGVDTDGDVIDPGKTGDVQVNLDKAGTYEMHSQDDNMDRSHELHGTVVVKG